VAHHLYNTKSQNVRQLSPATGLIHGCGHLRTINQLLAPGPGQRRPDQHQAPVKRFRDVLENIAALPCLSDLPLCHNPGCASRQARRAFRQTLSKFLALPFET
jgi:hypothetical protein